MSVKVRETRERKERDNVLRNKTPYRSSDGGTERGGGVTVWDQSKYRFDAEQKS